MPEHDVHDPFDRDMVSSMPPPDLRHLSWRGRYETRPRSLAAQLRDHAITRIGLDPSKLRLPGEDGG